MYLRKLTLTNLRAFENAAFDFGGEAGLHLLVGVNGVGKSTVLDALRVLFSRLLPDVTAATAPALSFSGEDLRVGAGQLTAELTCTFDGQEAAYLYRPAAPEHVTNPEQRTEVRAEDWTPEEISDWQPVAGHPFDKTALFDRVKKASYAPLVVYFSPHRSLLTTESARESRTRGLAYAEALSQARTFNVREFAQWWLTRISLAEPGGTSAYGNVLDVLAQAAGSVLQGFGNLRVVSEPTAEFLLDKSGVPLFVRQLSDGERSLLTLVLDLARRLALANPALKNPLVEGRAVVLIDELDLHLHPGWQRDVVGRLEAAFPACQFIATTHSPQLIGEVKPERVQLIRLGANPPVVRPDQSLGMDSNWILRELMGTSDRDEETDKLTRELFAHIARREFDQANAALAALRERISGESAETQRAAGSIERIKLLGR